MSQPLFPLDEKRMSVQGLLALAERTILVGETFRDRARELTSFGYGVFDALHLAAAESAHVDALLSTDDRFVKRATRGIGAPRVVVENPLSWLEEQKRCWQTKK